MSAATSAAGRRGAPVRLNCAACAQELGGTVAFCPFCGTAQAVPVPAPPMPVETPPGLAARLAGSALLSGAAPHIPPPPAAAPPAMPPAAVPPRPGVAEDVRAGPAPRAAAQPAPTKPLTAAEAPSAGHAATAADPAGAAGQPPLPPPAGNPAAVPGAEPQAARRPPARPRRFPVKRLAALAAAGFLAYAWLRGDHPPPPGATLVVQVRAPNGGAISEGRILVDGAPAGAPGESLRVTPGSHGVTFEDPGWRSDPRPVTLVRDASVTVTLTAQEVPARLSLASRPPGATVRLRGRSLGRTPLDLTLEPGSHELTLSLDGYAPRVVPLSLSRGEVRTLGVDLAEAPAPAAPRTQPPAFDRGVATAITALQAAPSRTSEVIATLPSLSEVQVLAQVSAEDVAWLQVRAGGRQGYVRANSTVEPWEGWSRRHVLSGTIEDVTPGLGLVVAGTPVALAGIRPADRSPSGRGAARVLGMLGEVVRGQDVRCVPHDTATFVCKTADARDVAELYLMNGGAVVAAGALPYYFDAQRIAQERQKGVWSD